MSVFKKNKQFLTSNRENRLVSRHQSSMENFSQKEANNLNSINDAVKESYSNRLDLMKNLNQKLNLISSEQKQHQEILAQMQKELSQSNGQPLRREFNCLNETIVIEMSPNGEYQEALNGKPLNFLQWAIQTKQSKSSDNLNA